MRALYLVAAGAFLGCAGRATGEPGVNTTSLAENGSDMGDAVSKTSSLTAAVALAGSAVPAALPANTAVPSVEGFFAPAGCVTTQADAANPSVTITFQDCSGPWGLSHVSGTLQVAYTAQPPAQAALGQSLSLHVSAQGLVLRRALVDYSADAVVSTDGASRTMTYTAQVSGTTPRGRSFVHTGQWNLSWQVGGSCLTIDGSGQGKLGDRGAQSTLGGYKRCGSECAGGGHVDVVDEATGERVDVLLGGTSEATFTDAQGMSQITLGCAL